MASQTPNFDIRYPDQGDVVTLAHFQNMANDIDAALNTLDFRQADVLNRPAALALGPDPASQVVGPGTLTTLTLSSTAYDNTGMYNAGAPNRLTVQVAGVYLFVGQISGTLGNPSAINAKQLDIIINGTTPPNVSHKYNTENQTFVGSANVTFLYPMQIGNYAQLRFFWSGTGSAGAVTGVRLSARLLVEL